MPDFEPLIHPETGEQVGWTTEASDGALVALDLDGYIAAAINPSTGELLDHEAYVPADDGDDYEDDQAAAFEQRLAELEAYASTPPAPAQYPPPAYAPEPDPERRDADLEQQAWHEERKRDRLLLLREKRALGNEVTEAQVAGEDRIDLPAAIERLRERGEPLLDLDSGSVHERREARAQYMVERLADQERLDAHARGEDDLISDQPPASREAFDGDDRTQRHQYLAERLEGRADPSQLYSSSSFDDPNQW